MEAAQTENFQKEFGSCDLHKSMQILSFETQLF